MNKTIMQIVIVAVIALGVGFFGGMKYEQGGSLQANLAKQRAGGFNLAQRNGQQGGGIVGGEIISRDDKSVTVKLQNGGSKIVFFSDSTKIMKSVSGSAGDLSVGEQVTATGTANQDGSVTAQSVQIRQLDAQNSNRLP